MRNHHNRPVTRRIVTLATTTTLLVAGGLAAAGGGANAAVRPGAATAHSATAAAAAAGNPDPTSGPHRQALDPVTRKKVTVYKPAGATPVHPEKVSHPGQDGMGTVTSAHDGGRTAGTRAPAVTAAPAGLPGIDVSSYQGNVTWSSVAPNIDFAYAKATEGTYYTNPDFTNQYNGPYNAGLIRGAYHFGIPDNSTGASQADYFVAHGGGWSGDGKTLPGALDIEYNPYGAECYGLSKATMTAWIWDFVNEYAYDAGVYPVIYTTNDWWSTCTSGDTGFAGYDPLWVACYCTAAGTLPAGYGYYTFWQYADSGSEPGDQDVFNGTYSRLQALAAG
ncbi:MAG: lysozyme [Streptosporangiales bacterium]|nr:lysozyme [Streptosporangiales bacterium]